MRSWPPKITSPYDIPGWTVKEQHDQYKGLVNLLPKNPKVLEIGCGWGRSTWAWLDALPDTASFFILDHFELNYRVLQKTGIYPYSKAAKRIRKQNIDQREIFDTIIKQHPKINLLKTLWHMSGNDWKNHIDYTQEWDLVYLDDDHRYPAVSDWLERFTNVPIVCGDDYHSNHQGVVSAVDEYAEKTGCKKTILPGCFWVLKNS